MERSEKTGLGIALAGHVVLFGLLSASWLWPREEPPKTKAIDISLVDDVALESRAPPSPDKPDQSRAPEVAPPQDVAPPAPADAAPEVAPPAKQPEPAPAPKPAPQAPPKPEKKPVEKPEKAIPKNVKSSATPAKVTGSAKANGENTASRKTKAGGLVLDPKMLAAMGAQPTQSNARTPPGATMDAKAAADIGSAIVRQVQPCANRQVNPGPGASRIGVTVLLHINRDGSLGQRPEIVNTSGVDDENERYVDAVKRNAIATFVGCAPLRGLPTDLYDVPRGWKLFKLNYRLP